MRIFADDPEWGRQLVQPPTEEFGGVEGGHGVRLRSSKGWVLIEIEPPANRPPGVVCYGPIASERAVVEWISGTWRGGERTNKSIFLIGIKPKPTNSR